MRKKLTVTEFAEKVNKSRQTIYNYINKLNDNEREKYILDIDKKKYLTIDYQNILLQIFNVDENIFNEELENQIDVYDLNIFDDDEKEVVKDESDIIIFLKEQIQEKDKQIEDLHKLLAISNKEKLMLIEKTVNNKESLLSKVKKIFRRD